MLQPGTPDHQVAPFDRGVNNKNNKTPSQKKNMNQRLTNSVSLISRKLDKVLNIEKQQLNRKRRRNGRPTPQPRNPTQTASGIGSTILNHPAVLSGDPLALSVAAQVAPFSIPKGLAKKPDGGRNSQSFTARGVTSISIPSGSTIVGLVTPSVANDPATYSLAALVCASANLSAGTSTFTSATAAVAPLNCTMAGIRTDTPYAAATLEGGDYQWQIVGCGLRIRNVTEKLYRGGVLRYIIDEEGTHIGSLNSENTTLQSWMNYIDSDMRSVRKHFADIPNVEIVVPYSSSGWKSAAINAQGNVFASALNNLAGATLAPYGAGSIRFGGNTSTSVCGSGPVCIFYFTNSSSGAQMIDLEMVEHWEVHGRTISSLHTPGINHVQTQALVQNVFQHVATNHSHSPHLTFADVAKGAIKLAHNKAAVQDATTAATIVACL